MRLLAGRLQSSTTREVNAAVRMHSTSSWYDMQTCANALHWRATTLIPCSYDLAHRTNTRTQIRGSDASV